MVNKIKPTWCYRGLGVGKKIPEETLNRISGILEEVSKGAS